MGKFVINQTKTGFTFHLKAGNGETIGTSEVYTKKIGCRKGIESVKKNAPLAEVDGAKHPKFEVYQDKSKQHRFRLTAKNGQNILASEGYKSKASCLKGIDSVKKNAPDGVVEDGAE